jgi:hypothetical protein
VIAYFPCAQPNVLRDKIFVAIEPVWSDMSSYQHQRQLIGNLLSGKNRFLAETVQKFLQRLFSGQLGKLRFFKLIAAVFDTERL